MDSNIESMEDWVNKENLQTTKDVEVPKILFDQVIGQEEAGEVVKKAALQKRHVLLLGEPGTGKSMLAQSMVDFLPKEELEDIVVFHNPEDNNRPKIKTFPAGKGKEIVRQYQIRAEQEKKDKSRMFLTIVFSIFIVGLILSIITFNYYIVFLALLVAVMIYFFASMNPAMRVERAMVPKVLVSHTTNDKPPFIDSTGVHSGALLGDVRHDPFQSGGLETPSHDRVEAGNIHKADKGVLFIDEINLLRPESQQALLTAMQEKKFPISGQSERSTGALVQTEPVPCDFVLVAAGNLDAIQGMHPALRSRIRGYGYEVYVRDSMEDSEENRRKLLQFIAQEVVKDKKIPHFDKTAVLEIMKEAQKRSGRRGKLTLRLRELGGLIRASGDVAISEKASVVTADHVTKAKTFSKPVEQQIADRSLEVKRLYNTFHNSGAEIGTVNGLAVMGANSGMAEYTGIVMPIVAEVTPTQTKGHGSVIATGKLGEIAKEAVQNVSAVFKKISGKDLSDLDIYIQFIGTYEGVEGDSASVSIATAVISAIEEIPINQNIAMTGSLSVRGNVLPVGGVTAKVEAAIDAGLEMVIVPASNYGDIILDQKYTDKIKIVPVSTIEEVLEEALVKTEEKKALFDRITELLKPGPTITAIKKGRTGTSAA
ncbi:MAG: ATP-dependent protease LonB [Cuniculiplasma sp.]